MNLDKQSGHLFSLPCINYVRGRLLAFLAYSSGTRDRGCRVWNGLNLGRRSIFVKSPPIRDSELPSQKLTLPAAVGRGCQIRTQFAISTLTLLWVRVGFWRCCRSAKKISLVRGLWNPRASALCRPTRIHEEACDHSAAVRTVHLLRLIIAGKRPVSSSLPHRRSHTMIIMNWTTMIPRLRATEFGEKAALRAWSMIGPSTRPNFD